MCSLIDIERYNYRCISTKLPLFYATDVCGHVAKKAASLFEAANFASCLRHGVAMEAANFIVSAGLSNGDILFTSRDEQYLRGV